jgi:hypothetical protein
MMSEAEMSRLAKSWLYAATHEFQVGMVMISRALAGGLTGYPASRGSPNAEAAAKIRGFQMEEKVASGA